MLRAHRSFRARVQECLQHATRYKALGVLQRLLCGSEREAFRHLQTTLLDAAQALALDIDMQQLFNAQQDRLDEEEDQRLITLLRDGALGGAAGAVGGFTLKGMAASALPTIMSTTGTVVPGVGTIHGVTTAAVASFASAPVVTTVLPIAAIGCVGYAGWRYWHGRAAAHEHDS